MNALERYRSSLALLGQLAADDPRAKTLREDLAELARHRAWFEGSLAKEEEYGRREDLCPYTDADKIDSVDLRSAWMDGWLSYDG
jgi:ribosome modulation factor